MSSVPFFFNDIQAYLFFSVSDSQILPSELATQSVRIKEEQLRREEEKVLLTYFEERCVFAHTILPSATGDRIESTKRDQRKEARTHGKGNRTPVGS